MNPAKSDTMPGAVSAAPEQRNADRLSILGELTGDIMIAQPMSVTEISHDGVQILSTFPLQIDSLHDIRLRVHAQPLVAKCRVVHSSVVDLDNAIVRYRVGLQFVQMDPRLRDAVDAYLARVRAERGTDHASR